MLAPSPETLVETGRQQMISMRGGCRQQQCSLQHPFPSSQNYSKAVATIQGMSSLHNQQRNKKKTLTVQTVCTAERVIHLWEPKQPQSSRDTAERGCPYFPALPTPSESCAFLSSHMGTALLAAIRAWGSFGLFPKRGVHVTLGVCVPPFTLAVVSSSAPGLHGAASALHFGTSLLTLCCL